jgi:hypothetical protein
MISAKQGFSALSSGWNSRRASISAGRAMIGLQANYLSFNGRMSQAGVPLAASALTWAEHSGAGILKISPS